MGHTSSSAMIVCCCGAGVTMCANASRVQHRCALVAPVAAAVVVVYNGSCLVVVSCILVVSVCVMMTVGMLGPCSSLLSSSTMHLASAVADGGLMLRRGRFCSESRLCVSKGVRAPKRCK